MLKELLLVVGNRCVNFLLPGDLDCRVSEERKRCKVSAIWRMDRLGDRQRARTTTMIHPLRLRSWTADSLKFPRESLMSLSNAIIPYPLPIALLPRSLIIQSESITDPEARERSDHPPSSRVLSRATLSNEAISGARWIA